MRLIDADALLDKLIKTPRYFEVKFDIEEAPTVDAVPIRYGRWVDNRIPGSMLRGCSVCGFTCGSSSFFYCPSCGAKMNGATQ